MNSKNSLFFPKKFLLQKQNLSEFSKEEKNQLDKLNPLLEKLIKAIKDSNELKDFKLDAINKFLSSISGEESKLKDFYKKHSEIVEKLSQISTLIAQQNKEKMEISAYLENITHQRKLWKELNEKLFEKWNQLFDSFIEAINSNSEKNAGGGVSQTQKKNLKEQKQRKH